MGWLRCALFGVVIVCSGCGLFGGPKVITSDFQGRDCGIFTGLGDWLVYSWSPPVDLSRPVHLVIRNLATGRERELEADWYGNELAISGDMLVYESHQKGSDESDLIALNLRTDERTVLSRGRISNPVIAGETVAWQAHDGEGQSMITIGPVSGDYATTIMDSGRPTYASDTWPRLSPRHLVFLRFDMQERTRSIMYHEIASGTTERLPIDVPERTQLAVAGDYVVYGKGDDDVIYRMDFATKTEEKLVDAPRRSAGPVAYGPLVAWTTTMAPEKFEKIPGEPLIDARDFRSLHLHDMRSGRTKTLISDTFMVNRPTINNDGSVFALVPRGIVPGPDRITDIVQF